MSLRKAKQILALQKKATPETTKEEDSVEVEEPGELPKKNMFSAFQQSSE